MTAAGTRSGPSPSRLSDDDGTSLVALSAGVLVFLIFLLSAMQLLIGLHARTSVTTAAFDGARIVATAPIDHGDPAQLRSAQARAERRVRQMLGRTGDRATIDWTGTGDDVVVIRVRVDPPRFLLPGFSGAMGLDHVDQTTSVRVEQLR